MRAHMLSMYEQYDFSTIYLFYGLSLNTVLNRKQTDEPRYDNGIVVETA